MAYVFVANVGERDVTLNIGDQNKPEYRDFAKGFDGGAKAVFEFLNSQGANLTEMGSAPICNYLLQNFDNYKDCLMFPILKPSLEQAFDKIKPNSLQVILFGTDKNSDPTHRPSDTFDAAQLLKKLIEQDDQFSCKVIVNIQVIEGINPSDYEQAYGAIGKTINSNVIAHIQKSTIVKTIASLRGGTPALNSALRQHVVDIYGKNSILIEVDEPPIEKRREGIIGNGKIISTWPFRQNSLLRIVETFLERHDYSGVEELLGEEEVKCSLVKLVLRHAQARLNMDFDGAISFIVDSKIMSDRYKDWKTSAKQLGQQRLKELFLSAEILLKRRDYSSFVVRVATFCEMCRKWVAQLLIGCPIDNQFTVSNTINNYLSLITILDKRTDLLKAKERGRVIPSTWNVNKALLSALKQWGVSQHSGIATYTDAVHSTLKEFEQLEELRNDSAHSGEGCSLENLCKALSITYKKDDEHLLNTFNEKFSRTINEILLKTHTLEQQLLLLRQDKLNELYTSALSNLKKNLFSNFVENIATFHRIYSIFAMFNPTFLIILQPIKKWATITNFNLQTVCVALDVSNDKNALTNCENKFSVTITNLFSELNLLILNHKKQALDINQTYQEFNSEVLKELKSLQLSQCSIHK